MCAESVNSQDIITVDIVKKIDRLLSSKKKVTINDVADVADVSKKTVSRIINDSQNVKDETRKLVKEVIRLLHYTPDPQARALASRKSFLVGLIYDNPNAQYVVNMQMGILDYLRSNGRELVVHPCDRNNENLVDEIRDFVERQKLSGVILLPPLAEDKRLINLMIELDVPYVRITARRGNLTEPPLIGAQVISIDRVGCEAAGNHLARAGHKNIGYIGGNLLYPSAHERRAGFEAGLLSEGVKINPQFDEPGDYSFETGYLAALKILKQHNRPTAIIACNDEMAAGVYKAAYELNIAIPNELSVVGFDDAPLSARLTPPLTTVRLPTRDMGRNAAQMLVEIDNKGLVEMVFPSDLIVRGSTKGF